MSKAAGRMVVGQKKALLPLVVADSTFELEIRDKNVLLGEAGIESDKIQLIEMSDASWTIRVHKEGTWLYFHADLHDIPENLQQNLKKELFVSREGKKMTLNPSANYVGTFKICGFMSFSEFEKHFANDSITLSFRLVISCEHTSSLRKKFYDPLVARKSFIARFSNMLGDPTFSDFTFIVGGQEFKVHMNILAAVSPVMKKLFTTDLEEAKTRKCTIDAIDSKTFEEMLRFVYKGDIPEDLQAVAKPLYEAAHYYQIEELEQNCVREIRCSLSPENALEVFEWAHPYDLEELKIEAWTIIKRDILKIFVELKNEPLSLEKINAIIKQREQEKKFWMELVEEVVKKIDKTP